MTTKAEYDRAYLRGITDAQVGTKTNAFKHHPGREGDLLRSAWEEGREAHTKGEAGNGVD